jgi:hypothetical protein
MGDVDRPEAFTARPSPESRRLIDDDRAGIPATRIHGVVCDPTGWPIEKAALIAEPAGHADAAHRSAFTDRDGRYELRLPGPGRWLVAVHADGFETSRAELSVGARVAGRLDFHLPTVFDEPRFTPVGSTEPASADPDGPGPDGEAMEVVEVVEGSDDEVVERQDNGSDDIVEPVDGDDDAAEPARVTSGKRSGKKRPG